MTALTNDKRNFERIAAEVFADPVAASTLLYGGAFVCLNGSGYAVAAANTKGYTMRGAARARADNSAGANGAINVETWAGEAVEAVGSGLTIADVGKMAYIVDDQTITLTPGFVQAGKIVKVESATKCFVDPRTADRPRQLESMTLELTAASTDYVLSFTASRKLFIHTAYVAAETKPDYASATLAVSRHDASGDTDDNVLSAANFDLESLAAAKEGEELTLSTTLANRQLDPGDTINVTISIGATEATAGEGITVTFELEG